MGGGFWKSCLHCCGGSSCLGVFSAVGPGTGYSGPSWPDQGGGGWSIGDRDIDIDRSNAFNGGKVSNVWWEPGMGAG